MNFIFVDFIHGKLWRITHKLSKAQRALYKACEWFAEV